VEIQSDALPAQLRKVRPGPDNELVVAGVAEIQIEVRAEGCALPRASVSVKPVSAEGTPPWLPTIEFERFTDAEGVAVFHVAADMPQDIRVALEGFLPAKAAWRPPGDGAPVVVELAPTRHLVGAVVDRYGSPVEGARVSVIGGGPRRELISGARGEFSIDLHDGKGRIEALHPRLGRGHAEVQGGADDDFVVELDQPVIDIDRWAPALAERGCELWADGDAVVVEALETGGSADRAGLVRGDLLLDVRQGGQGLRVEVLRGDDSITVTLPEP
jgi:hypothetical protein